MGSSKYSDEIYIKTGSKESLDYDWVNQHDFKDTHREPTSTKEIERWDKISKTVGIIGLVLFGILMVAIAFSK